MIANHSIILCALTVSKKITQVELFPAIFKESISLPPFFSLVFFPPKEILKAVGGRGGQVGVELLVDSTC